VQTVSLIWEAERQSACAGAREANRSPFFATGLGSLAPRLMTGRALLPARAGDKSPACQRRLSAAANGSANHSKMVIYAGFSRAGENNFLNRRLAQTASPGRNRSGAFGCLREVSADAHAPRLTEFGAVPSEFKGPAKHFLPGRSEEGL
jgi:hypothetical protein